MKIPHILAIFCCLGSILVAREPLTANRLLDIIASEHSNQLKVDALKIYPEGRTYKITVEVSFPDGSTFADKLTAAEKWVEGNYIVSEAKHSEREDLVAMVLEYDKDHHLYRKYILINGELVGYQIGTRIGTTRSISWINFSTEEDEAKEECITVETSTDDATTWKSIFFKDENFLRFETGKAEVSSPSALE